MAVIGLTQRILYHKGRAYDSIEHGWYSYLKDHVLFYIPNNLDNDFDHIADLLDVLIITGGDDSALRRTVETKIATKILQRNKPVLGICHGAFLLADLLGAKIVEVENHNGVEHEINYFGEIRKVNSHHDLAIYNLPKTATVLCTDQEGYIESWIDGNLAGIVWHPERMDNPWIPDEIHSLIFRG